MRQFLINYCVEQKLAGYVMVQDPLAFFYEAICVGLDWDDDDVFEPSPTNSGLFCDDNLISHSHNFNWVAKIHMPIAY